MDIADGDETVNIKELPIRVFTADDVLDNLENDKAKYLVAIEHVHQYTEGYTGQTLRLKFYTNNLEGYMTKSEANSKIRELKRIHKTKHNDNGIGHYYNIQAIAVSNIVKYITGNSSFSKSIVE